MRGIYFVARLNPPCRVSVGTDENYFPMAQGDMLKNYCLDTGPNGKKGQNQGKINPDSHWHQFKLAIGWKKRRLR